MPKVTTLSRRPKPDSADLAAFLLIIGQYRTGSKITVDLVRLDLEAAQIRPASYGALFAVAVQRGELEHTGQAIRVRKGSRRGGWAAIYKKTRPRQEARRPAARPAGRRDSKGPRR